MNELDLNNYLKVVRRNFGGMIHPQSCEVCTFLKPDSQRINSLSQQIVQVKGSVLMIRYSVVEFDCKVYCLSEYYANRKLEILALNYLDRSKGCLIYFGVLFGTE